MAGMRPAGGNFLPVPLALMHNPVNVYNFKGGHGRNNMPDPHMPKTQIQGYGGGPRNKTLPQGQITGKAEYGPEEFLRRVKNNLELHESAKSTLPDTKSHFIWEGDDICCLPEVEAQAANLAGGNGVRIEKPLKGVFADVAQLTNDELARVRRLGSAASTYDPMGNPAAKHNKLAIVWAGQVSSTNYTSEPKMPGKFLALGPPDVTYGNNNLKVPGVSIERIPDRFMPGTYEVNIAWGHSSPYMNLANLLGANQPFVEGMNESMVVSPCMQFLRVIVTLLNTNDGDIDKAITEVAKASGTSAGLERREEELRNLYNSLESKYREITLNHQAGTSGKSFSIGQKVAAPSKEKVFQRWLMLVAIKECAKHCDEMLYKVDALCMEYSPAAGKLLKYNIP